MAICFFLIRLGIGILFVVSGTEKILSPSQNFLYVLENYDMFPRQIAVWMSYVFPWIEFLVGLCLCLGLWLRPALQMTLGMFLCFQIVVAQAILRQLPIDECGCFGEIISFPLSVIFIFDTCMLLLSFILLRYIQRTSLWSLDVYFSKS